MGYIASLLPTWCLAEMSGGSPGRGWEWKASLEVSVEAVNRWAGQGRAATIRVKPVYRQDPLRGLAARLRGRSRRLVSLARPVMRDLSWAGTESLRTGKELAAFGHQSCSCFSDGPS